MAINYFHNYAYRHLLRSPRAYAEWKQLKRAPSSKWWDSRYNDIYRAFQRENLEPNGFSAKHTEIIDRILNMKGKAIAAYSSDRAFRDTWDLLAFSQET